MNNMTTPEETDDILKYIVLPMLLDLINNWSTWPEFTPLKHLHKSQFQELLDIITIDHVEIKQRLKAANVKVVQNWKVGPTLDYKIYVRRYEENMSFWKGHIKSVMSVTLGKYVARLDKSKFIAQPVVEDKKDVMKDRHLYVNFD